MENLIFLCSEYTDQLKPHFWVHLMHYIKFLDLSIKTFLESHKELPQEEKLGAHFIQN